MYQSRSETAQRESATLTKSQPTTNAGNVIKVAATSKTTAVAGAIAGTVREHNHAEVQAIGAGAVNQAIKAVAVAVGYLESEDIHLICIPYFSEVTIEGLERTAVRFRVEPRQ